MEGVQNRLDSIVVDIEFLLISVVQGLALAALAQNSSTLLSNGQYQYWPYIVSGFFLILIFWSQAITHVLSFIRWPIDMNHNFLYFLACLIEVMIFAQMQNPRLWFAFYLVFVLVSGVLYSYDLYMIKSRRELFARTEDGKKLYTATLKNQLFEIKVFVPAGIAFTLGAYALIQKYPQIFLVQKYHLILITLQIIFGIIILVHSLSMFNKRMRLIAKDLT